VRQSLQPLRSLSDSLLRSLLNFKDPLETPIEFYSLRQGVGHAAVRASEPVREAFLRPHAQLREEPHQVRLERRRNARGVRQVSPLGDAKSSLGDTLRARWVMLRARWVTR
jgi:hypothetical protein